MIPAFHRGRFGLSRLVTEFPNELDYRVIDWYAYSDQARRVRPRVPFGSREIAGSGEGAHEPQRCRGRSAL